MSSNENAKDAMRIVNSLAAQAITILMLDGFSADKMACMASGFHLAVINALAKKLQENNAPAELISSMKKGILERTAFTSRLALDEMGVKTTGDEIFIPLPNQPSVIRHVTCELEAIHDEVEVEVSESQDAPFANLTVRIGSRGGFARISLMQIALDAIARCLSGPGAAKMIDSGRTE